MDSEGRQKELFPIEEKSRAPFPRLEKMLPKPDFEGKVSITFGLDRIVFISMGIMLAAVVIFAIGVERGRSIEREAIAAVRITAIAAEQALTPVSPATLQAAKTPPPATPAAAVTHRPAPAIERAKDDIGAKPYTIVAASFKGRESGQLSIERLKKEGIDAYLTQNGPYFVVCVGGFSNRDAAQGLFARVKRLYKDAYIKLR